jgi:hypothetical protein
MSGLVLYSYMVPWVESYYSCMCHRDSAGEIAFRVNANRSPSLIPSISLPPMPNFNAATKHAILLEYIPSSPTHSYAAVAQRHGVAGGKSTIKRWHDRWDGTPASLEDKPRSGRPRLLTPADVSRHVRAPILAANRGHHAVRYTDLLPKVREKTGKHIALRTLQDYGQQQLRAKQKHTKKRTAAESE